MVCGYYEVVNFFFVLVELLVCWSFIDVLVLLVNLLLVDLVVMWLLLLLGLVELLCYNCVC